MDNRKIGIAIPTYNRVDVLIESFSKVLFDERVESIHIQDDASDIQVYYQVKSMVETLNSVCNDKITLGRNLTNVDCFRNKYHSVLASPSKNIILLDSDNSIGIDYLDKLYEIVSWGKDTIYTPDFSMPNFDFRDYSGLLLTKENVAEQIDKPMLETALNAANYFFNKEKWVATWNGDIDPVTSDSIYVCLKWLEAGNKIKVVEGLQYFHRVWEDSHYRTNISRTPVGLHQDILNQLRNLK